MSAVTQRYTRRTLGFGGWSTTEEIVVIFPSTPVDTEEMGERGWYHGLLLLDLLALLGGGGTFERPVAPVLDWWRHDWGLSDGAWAEAVDEAVASGWVQVRGDDFVFHPLISR